jgi:mannose-1-phosphate guanylyltransferase
LFQHTLGRADRLTAADHKVIVIARSHAWEAWSQLGQRPSGTVILQPADRNTSAEIFLPVTYVAARDPQATVVIYPSDHFVYPEQHFLDSVQRAIWTAEWLPDRLVLLGVSPDRLELDYGWIQPGEELDRSSNYQIQGVHAFLDKPTAAQADAALAAGALWNTSVVVAKVETLWELGWQCSPDIMPNFDRLRAAIGTSYEAKTLETIYEHLPTRNFSSELLLRVPERLAVVEVPGVLWSDWSRPEQIAHTLRQIRRQPAFPLASLSRPFAPITGGVAEAAY